MIALLLAGSRRAWAAGLVLLVLGGVSSEAQERALRPVRVVEKRALLIGNAEYEGTSRLVNTIPDVRALEGALKDLKFNAVSREENLTLRQMMAAVRRFTAGLEAGDLALFYYSGHGVQVSNKNYLLPVDYERETQPAEVSYAALSVKRVQDMLKGTGAKVRVLVLDACRNNPYGDGRSAGGGLAAMDAEGDLIVYATGAGDVASDNAAGELGLYMTHLLPELRGERVELKEAFDRTRAAVYEASTERGESQRPAQYEDLIGRVYLRGGPPGAAPVIPVTPPSPPVVRTSPPPARAKTAAERWQQVKGAERPEQLEAYIENYREDPESAMFVRLAEVRLKAVEKILRERAAEEEQKRLESSARAAWGAVQEAGDAETLGTFVRLYGKVPGVADLVEQARGRLEEMARRELEEALSAGSMGSVEAYLGKYGEMPGAAELVGQARERLEALRFQERAARRWEQIKHTRNSGELAAFVKEFGNLAGAADLVHQARSRLERLREAVEAMEFVWIPAGEFRMGSTSRRADDDEKPVTRVRISRGFYLGKYEVTQGQWEAVMGTNPSHFSNCGGNCPVEGVSWHDVQGFIGMLNAKDGKPRYRLPTEAEWEYAARAGTRGDRYGNVDAIAWYDGNSGARTHPVGRKAPNAFGLYDMLGNVWEWVEDWYGDYPGGAMTDPTGPSTGGSYRVYRGGCWYDDARDCRSAYRYWDSPGIRIHGLGFRLLRTE